MSLWQATDANTSAPKFAVFQGLGVSANGNVLFDNVQTGAFVSGVGIGVFGVSAAEAGNTSGEGPKVAHSGWVNRKEGSGPIAGISITSGGKGYANGFLSITGGGASNTTANASYAVRANGSVDTVTIATPGAGYSNGFVTITNGGTGNSAANISYTVNAAGNIVSVIINNGGSNYDSVPTLAVLGSNTATASLTATTNTGVIVGVTLVTPGSGYVSTPTVAATGANNATAVFAATMGGRANRVQFETLVATGSIGADSGADDTQFPGA